MGATGIVPKERRIREPPVLVRCECSTARISVVANNRQAHQMVMRTRAVVVPAPNTVSVMPPPNAAPTPCSEDFCINTNRITNTATTMWIAVKIRIKMLISSTSIPSVRLLRYSAAFTIPAKPFASKLAPPTNAPSISDWPSNSFAFAGFTLPPY